MELKVQEGFEVLERDKFDAIIKTSCYEKDVLANPECVLAANTRFVVERSFCHGLVHHSVIVILETGCELDCLDKF